MARILWLGDAGCTTGFGRVSHGIGDRLVEQYGHDVHCLAVNYTGDYWPTPMKLYVPTAKNGGDLYGQSRFVEMFARVMPDIVIMLNDPYVILRFLFKNRWDEEAVLARTRPILAYMPVDGHNQPTPWSRIPELVNNLPPIAGGTGPDFRPVLMSNWGKALYPDAPVVYHGIDTDKYRPVSESNPMVASSGAVIRSKADAKRMFGFDKDDFLVLRVDRNSIRKNFAETWKALLPVMKRHKNVYAWFHCKAEGDQLELPQLISRDPDTASRFKFPGNFSTKVGWSDADLAILYNAADLFVSTSTGEGFGLTIAEAVASGVPVIAQDCSSITEVAGPGGVLIQPERPWTTDSGQDLWMPNVEAFTEAIESLYGRRSQRKALGEAGRNHAVANFSWDEAAKQFDRLIRETLAGGSDGFSHESA